jgi:hypothetical protein
MVVKSALPDSSLVIEKAVELTGTDGLGFVEHFAQGCFIKQLDQPVRMIGHYNESQCFRMPEFSIHHLTNATIRGELTESLT